MNTLILRRLVWKEFRTTVALWVAMVGLCLVLDIGQSSLPRDFFDYSRATPGMLELRVAWLYSIAMIVTGLYAVACAGMQYAIEHENGTFGLLRSLPITTREVLWTKAGWAVASTAVLGVLLLGMTFLWTGGKPLPTQCVAVYGVFILEGLAWGTFFSLRASRVMTAIFQAGIVIALCLGALSSIYGWLGNMVFSDQNIVNIYAGVWPYRLLIVAIVAALDVQLALRWFERWKVGGKGGRLAESLGDRFRGQWRMPHRARRGEFWELCRHHVRQSRTVLGLCALPVCLWVLTMLLVLVGIIGRTVAWPGLAAVATMGVGVVYPSLAFQADQRRRGYRFLSHHGVTPRKAWWSRQVVWMTCLLLLICLFFIALPLMDKGSPVTAWEALRDTPNLGGIMGTAVALVLTAYASGSLASILLRSGILAVGFGITLTIGMLSLGGFLVPYLGWLPMLVIPLGFFIAGRLHAADWLAERRSWRSRARWMTPAFAPFVLLVLATPLLRIYGYPDAPDPGFSPSRLRAEAYSPAGVARLAELVAIARLPRKAIVIEATRSEPERRKSQILSDEGFKRLVAFAADGPKPGPYQEMTWEAPWAVVANGLDTNLYRAPVALTYMLCGRMHETVQDYEQAGRLREALDGRIALVRLYAVVTPYGSYASIVSGIDAWAKRKGMTPELLREGIKRLDEVSPDRVDYTLTLKLEYLVGERALVDDQWFETAYEDVGQKRSTLQRLLPALCPWERTRALRRLRYLYRQTLDDMDFLIGSFSDPNAPPVPRSFDDWRRERDAKERFEDACDEFLLGISQTSMNLVWGQPIDRIELFERQRRVAQINLAVEGWKLQHGGKLPDTLQQLVGVYFEQLPVDPMSKKPFRYATDNEKENKKAEYEITSR